MTIKPHAFVAMPFGAKPYPNGQFIDFNRIYNRYIKPALEAVGLERLAIESALLMEGAHDKSALFCSNALRQEA